MAWEVYNERKPFGNCHSFGKDGEKFGKIRWEAIKAVRAGTASAEQEQLVADADEAMQTAMAARPKD
jgi:hypothetical protein